MAARTAIENLVTSLIYAARMIVTFIGTSSSNSYRYCYVISCRSVPPFPKERQPNHGKRGMEDSASIFHIPSISGIIFTKPLSDQYNVNHPPVYLAAFKI
jgi:hypothetical protein